MHNQTRIEPAAGGLAFFSPYSPAMVADLKSRIPASGRKWDNIRKAWIVDPQYGKTLLKLASTYYNETPSLPLATSAATTEQRILEVRYIGAAKDRGDGESSSFGLIDKDWSAIFPEAVLRAWFEDAARPGEERTLFGVLSIKQDASGDEIKAAYRRLAKQWHPDVCREPDAAEQFKKINEAYQTLSDDIKRAKYLAGLKMVASLGGNRRGYNDELLNLVYKSDYRPPLRCGLIIADGQERLGRFIVSKIHAWADITNKRGQVLVTSWPAGAKEPVEVWS